MNNAPFLSKHKNEQTEVINRKILSISPGSQVSQSQVEIFTRVQMAIIMPREWLDVQGKLLTACENPDFAKEAVYSKPAADGKVQRGLSIRFAEHAKQVLRNISVDTAHEREDEEASYYRMTLVDLETNTPTSETFRVSKTVERFGVRDGDTVIRQRTNSDGLTVYVVPASEEQLFDKLSAMKSRVRRQLILSVIPAEVRAACLARCLEVSADTAAKNPADALKSVVASYLSLGVEVSDLKEYLGKSVQSATPAELQELREMNTTIREGNLSWNDIMDTKRERAAVRGSKAEFLAAKQKEKEQSKQKAPSARAAAASTSQGAGEGTPKPGRNKKQPNDSAATPPPTAPKQPTSTSNEGTAGEPAPTRPSRGRRDSDDENDDAPASRPTGSGTE